MNTSESPNAAEIRFYDKLHETVREVKEQTLASYDLNSAWMDSVYDWNSELKQQVLERYGTTKFLQQIPAWQVMVGGTVEEPVDVLPEQIELVETSVKKFLEQFKRANGLD